jgi:hypothetical protein
VYAYTIPLKKFDDTMSQKIQTVSETWKCKQKYNYNGHKGLDVALKREDIVLRAEVLQREQ